MKVQSYLITPGTQGFGIELPVGAVLAGVGVESPAALGATAYLYALGDPNAETETRTFFAPKVGADLLEDLSCTFVGNVTLTEAGARTTYHVFEVVE